MTNNIISFSFGLMIFSFKLITFAESITTATVDLFINGRPTNTTLTKNGYEQTIELRISVFESNYIIDLHLNTKLFSTNYKERVLTSRNESFTTKSLANEHCYYVGRVRYENNSMAAIDTCYHIRGFFSIGNTSYTIAPKSTNGPSALYDISVDSNDTTLTWICGVKHSSNLASLISGVGNIPPQNYARDHLAVEFFLSISNGQYNYLNKNATAVFTNAKAIANTINVIYNSVGINIILVGSEIFSEADPFLISKDNDETLANFCKYRQQKLNNLIRHDNAHLLVSVTECFNNKIIGYAHVDSMCSSTSSCGIDCNYNENAAITGKVLAHEMGHNFGLQHDDEPSYGGCYCSLENKCIMAPFVYTDPFAEFSTCSKDRLAQFIPARKICLQDKPELVFQDLIFCGNGIIDAGETCDCGGFNQSCNSNCCNVTTCQLIGSAKCASGLCCDVSTCKVQPGGYVCRKSDNDCDLVEFCDGDKGDCPVDTYRRNGENCISSNIAGKCYNGNCGSRTAQCNILWGSDSTEGIQSCYDYNRNGNEFGNCGIVYGETNTYVPCANSDVLCGLLHCNLANNKDFSSQIFKTNYIGGGSLSSTPKCYSLNFDFGVFYTHPGFVPNGAICGDSKYCVNQKCVSAVVDTSGCPNCKPNWTCNNVGNCQCINGYQEKECWERLVTSTIADLSTVKLTTLLTTTVPLYSSIKSTEKTSIKSETTFGITSTEIYTTGTDKPSSVTISSYKTASTTLQVTETPTLKMNPTTTDKVTEKLTSQSNQATTTQTVGQSTLNGNPSTTAALEPNNNSTTMSQVDVQFTTIQFTKNQTTPMVDIPNNLPLIIGISLAVGVPVIVLLGLLINRCLARKAIAKSPADIFAASPVYLYQPANTYNNAQYFRNI